MVKNGFKMLVSLILISQIFLMSCGSLETSCDDAAIEKLETNNKGMPDKEDIIEAYINAMNKMTWWDADDYDVGSIKYYELFQMFSVEVFECRW